MPKKEDLLSVLLRASAGVSGTALPELLKMGELKGRQRLDFIVVLAREQLKLDEKDVKWLATTLNKADVEEEVIELFSDKTYRKTDAHGFFARIRMAIKKIETIDHSLAIFFHAHAYSLSMSAGAARRERSYLGYLESHSAIDIADTYWRLERCFAGKSGFLEALNCFMVCGPTEAEIICDLLFKAIHRDADVITRNWREFEHEFSREYSGFSTKLLIYLDDLRNEKVWLFQQNIGELWARNPTRLRKLVHEGLELPDLLDRNLFFTAAGLL